MIEQLLSQWALASVRDIAFFIVGLMVLLPLLFWQGRKRWLRGWTEEEITAVGIGTFIVALVGFAIYNNYFRG